MYIHFECGSVNNQNQVIPGEGNASCSDQTSRLNQMNKPASPRNLPQPPRSESSPPTKTNHSVRVQPSNRSNSLPEKIRKAPPRLSPVSKSPAGLNPTSPLKKTQTTPPERDLPGSKPKSRPSSPGSPPPPPVRSFESYLKDKGLLVAPEDDPTQLSTSLPSSPLSKDGVYVEISDIRTRTQTDPGGGTDWDPAPPRQRINTDPGGTQVHFCHNKNIYTVYKCLLICIYIYIERERVVLVPLVI